MAKLGALAPTRTAQTPASEIPAQIELEASLYSDKTDEASAQFRGRAFGGAIRVRLYLIDGRTAEDAAGEIFTGSAADPSFVTTKKYADGSTVTKVEWKTPSEVLVMWGPVDYDFDLLRVIV